jgi:hypothetical protein
MGGDLVLRHDSNGYRLHHTNYRDTIGIPAYNNASMTMYKWDAIAGSWTLVAGAQMPIDSPSSFILLTGMPYGVEVYNYYSKPGVMDSLLNLNGSGKYRCIVSDCCRNAIIGNMTTPGGESLVLTCEFNYDSTGVVIDNTPEYLAIPVIYGPINNAWAYNPLPYDADGDSLSWEINTPIGQSLSGVLDTCAGYTLPPADPTGPFTLNAVTGEFTWTPNMLGNFVASFKIHEFRGGVEIGTVVRDMQYVVIQDTSSSGSPLKMPGFAQGTPYNVNTSGNYNFIYYNPGMPFKFDILAEDQNATDVVTLEANSELFKAGVSNAAFSFVNTGVGNQVKGTFTWTPDILESRDKILAIRAKDGTFIKDFTILLRKFTAPNGVNEADKQHTSMHVFPNPNRGQTISMNIVSDKAYDNALLDIYDLTGRQIESVKAINIISGNTVVQRSLELPAGTYLLQLRHGSSVLAMTKYSKM